MINKTQLIYLACPFYHADENIRTERTAKANEAAAILFGAGYTFFSPLSHGEKIAKLIHPNDNTHQMWLSLDLAILECCDILLILPIPGWQESLGVRDEIIHSLYHNTPIYVWAELPTEYAFSSALTITIPNWNGYPCP